MDNTEKVVNGLRFLPPSLGAWIAKDIPARPYEADIPWTPLKRPIRETAFTLMTSAGISMKTDPPFDVAREKREEEPKLTKWQPPEISPIVKLFLAEIKKAGAAAKKK